MEHGSAQASGCCAIADCRMLRSERTRSTACGIARLVHVFPMIERSLTPSCGDGSLPMYPFAQLGTWLMLGLRSVRGRATGRRYSSVKHGTPEDALRSIGSLENFPSKSRSRFVCACGCIRGGSEYGTRAANPRRPSSHSGCQSQVAQRIDRFAIAIERWLLCEPLTCFSLARPQ